MLSFATTAKPPTPSPVMRPVATTARPPTPMPVIDPFATSASQPGTGHVAVRDSPEVADGVGRVLASRPEGDQETSATPTTSLASRKGTAACSGKDRAL